MQDLHIWDSLDKVKKWWQNIPLAKRMFWLMLVFYFGTRLVGLTQFPIYFFGDEAAQVNRAADLVRDEGYGYDEVYLPTFFANNSSYILGTSVYIQVLPYLLFGRSVFWARFTPMLITLLAVIWVSLTLRDIYKVKHWWTAGFFLSIAPAWFLHSRTAFETVLFVTFYAGFLYHYLMYRKGKTWHLLLSLFWGSVAFYSYTAGQIIMVVSGVLFLLFDIKYHWKHRKLWPWAALVLGVCVIPFIRFMVVHPEEYSTRLVNYGSYWVGDMPFFQKAWMYIKEYVRGRSALYWFFPNHQDLDRHLMKGYGHIHWSTLPFMLIGIWRLWVDHRKEGTLLAILGAALAAPSGAATVHIGITRVLVTVVPVVITAGLGLQYVITWLQTKVLKSWKSGMVARFVFVLMATFNVYMAWDALVNGPTWYTDYGLFGMQWGAEEIFDEVKRIRAEDPEARFDISPNWANNFNELEVFFLGAEDLEYISYNSLDGYRQERRDLDETTILMMPKEEYESLKEDPLFTDLKILNTTMAPDFSIAYYWVTVTYSAEAEAIFAEIEAQRKEIMPDTAVVDGVKVNVAHSYLDMGEIQGAFDDDLGSVIRSGGSNPMNIIFTFDEPKTVESIAFLIGSGPTRIQMEINASDGTVLDLDEEYEHVYDVRWAYFGFDEELQVDSIAVKQWNSNEVEPAHVHLWEIKFNVPEEELP